MAPRAPRVKPRLDAARNSMRVKRSKRWEKIRWSGRRESNPHHQLGRLRSYHYTTPALLYDAYFIGFRASRARALLVQHYAISLPLVIPEQALDDDRAFGHFEPNPKDSVGCATKPPSPAWNGLLAMVSDPSPRFSSQSTILIATVTGRSALNRTTLELNGTKGTGSTWPASDVLTDGFPRPAG